MAQRNASLPCDTAIKALEAFTGQKVPYVIVGAAALVLHGIPRATLDVDIVVPAGRDVIASVFKAANSAGLRTEQADMLSLAENPQLIVGQWVSFQDRKKQQLIDVFFEDAKQFEKLHRRSVKREGRRASFHVACLRDLEKMKKASGRAIDLADIALIRELRRTRRLKGKNS